MARTTRPDSPSPGEDTAMSKMAIARLAAVVLAVLSWAGAATAADEPKAPNDLMLGGFSLSGEVEAGARFFVERPPESRRQKFEEYKDESPGPFLSSINLSAQRPDGYGMELSGTK